MGFRDLPSVHEVVESLAKSGVAWPREVVLREVRAVLADARAQLSAGAVPADPILTVTARLERLHFPSLRRVINATGVILHTNLGRAPLARFGDVEGYCNLEYDLGSGKRGRRDAHLAPLLETLLGTPAIAVNNNAAALFLVLNELAAGGETIVSRGELVEIGEGFRIAEIMQRSGSALREVGSTNRTTAHDYKLGVNDRTRLLLRVHQSNFRMTGFTARPELNELVALSRETGIPLYEDLGSGCVVDLGLSEPLVQDSLAAGVNVVSFSGDKLLGGPQAGIIAGDEDLVRRMRSNPLFRALRLDKLFTASMEVTLRHLVMGEQDQIPAIRMIRMTADEIRQRAVQLVAQINQFAELIAGESVIGGGSTPEHSLPTWLISLPPELEKKLRAHVPPIIARIENGRTLMDLRTVFPREEDAIVQALS